MVVKSDALIVELRKIVAGSNGESNSALRTLAVHMLELAELVRTQDEKIEILTKRLDLRAR